MEDEIYVLIESYLNKDLTPEESHAFEERIKNNPKLAQLVDAYRDISKHITVREARKGDEKVLKETLSNISEVILKEVEGETTVGKQVSLNRFYWVAAASVFLVGVAFLYFSHFTSYPLYSEYATHDPLALTVRGDEDSLKLKAEETFNQGDYILSVEFLSELLKNDPENTRLQLYLAIALLEADQYDEAESYLDLIRQGQSVFKDKATWYLALSNLKQKKYNRCKELLEEIPDASDDYLKAQALLEDF
jgi:hypothetical protein